MRFNFKGLIWKRQKSRRHGKRIFGTFQSPLLLFQIDIEGDTFGLSLLGRKDIAANSISVDFFFFFKINRCFDLFYHNTYMCITLLRYMHIDARKASFTLANKKLRMCVHR